MHCWFRLKRHVWGPWYYHKSNIPAKGYYAYISECEGCAALKCRLLRW